MVEFWDELIGIQSSIVEHVQIPNNLFLNLWFESQKEFEVEFTFTRTADSFSLLKCSHNLRIDSMISSELLLLSESDIWVRICKDSLLFVVCSSWFDSARIVGPALLIERFTVMRSFLCEPCTWFGCWWTGKYLNNKLYTECYSSK